VVASHRNLSTRSVLLTAVAATLLALAVTSCRGGSSTPKGTQGPGLDAAIATQVASGDAATVGVAPDACALLTADEAGALVGEAVRKETGEGQPAGGGISHSGCFYAAASGSSKSVNVEVNRFASRSDLAASFRRVRMLSSGVEDVPGVGEGAFYVSALGRLNVLVKDSWLIISVVERQPGAAPSGATGAALKALGSKTANRLQDSLR
jgi:hypothetical protein